MRSICIATAVFLFAATAAHAADRKVDIINETGVTMVEFYASVTSTNSWEEDLLGDNELADGETIVANIDDGSGKCIFDFRAVFEDGAEAVKQKVNVCRISSFTFTP